MRQRNLLVAALLFGSVTTPAGAVEPWADPNLKVTAGLQVWLDAGRQNTARRALKRPELADGQPVALCYDGSGLARHLEQKDAAAQPLFRTTADYTALRFDGDRQHLTRTGLGATFKALTIFVVATPFA